jgi:hypothetical protein
MNSDSWQQAADRLSAVLADRLNRILPEGFTAVDAQGIFALIDPGGDLIVGKPLGWMMSAEDSTRQLAAVVERALCDVQDGVSVVLTIPWPAVAHGQPMPHAAVLEGVLEMWFGDQQQPFLRLEPIPLEELGLGTRP